MNWLSLKWDAVVVRFHEIALKGKNRPLYVKALQNNVQRVLDSFQVGKSWDLLIIKTDNVKEVIAKVSKVFGVAHCCPVRFVDRSVEAMAAVSVDVYEQSTSKGDSFAIRVRRSDKTFPLTSSETEREVGKLVCAKTNAPVDLKNPVLKFSFQILTDRVFLVGPKMSGPGGLPLGMSGKVATFLSGGIDSPVAAWLIMRRGCSSDFVHFHALRNADEVKQSKMLRLASKILVDQGVSARFFVVPSDIVQLSFSQFKVPEKLELILFRRFMVCLANRLAEREGWDALVSGDNLGQVASQTMDNLKVVDSVTKIPIFRPLITYGKEEIIALAQSIGTFDLSIEDYKDCCAIIAKHPKTRPSLEEVEKAEKLLPMNDLLEKTLAEVTIIQVPEK